jgi:hypothetical protein
MPLMPTLETGRSNAAFSQLTSLASAVGICDLKNAEVIIQAETQAIRVRVDGADPTTTVGHLIAAGESYRYYGDLSKVNIIEAAASAKANVHVFW